MAREEMAFPSSIPHADKRAAGRTDASRTPLTVRSPHMDVPEWLDFYVHERAGRKLGKHALRIGHITVRFDDVNGPKKGVDITCRVKIEMPRRPSVFVEERGTDPKEAFDKALEVAELNLVKSLEPMRATRRGRDERRRARRSPRGDASGAPR